MNSENIHRLIDLYEQNIDTLNNDVHDEKFKWHAVQSFHNAWNAPEAASLPFDQLFHCAVKDSAVLVNNSTVQPANGMVKLAEKDPQEVERLVRDVLFAEDGGDLDLRQRHMDEFLDGMEALLQRYYPANWKYRQDRHAASCYLAMYAPEKNYIYKYSSAEAFAVYTEFGKDIGSGSSFNLANYYEMCDGVAAALREHPGLLKKHAAFLDDTYYKDDSLHLLAFDIIYCAHTYGYLEGMEHRSKKESIRIFQAEEKRRKEEMERLEVMDDLRRKMDALEREMEDYRSISLKGTQVRHKMFGTGTVVSQQVNRVCVRFGDVEKQFVISSRFPMRPVFEDDEEIVAAMTDYGIKHDEYLALKKKLAKLEIPG